MITVDQKIAEYLNNWTIDGWPIGNFVLCLIALFLSVLLCGLIGMERERRRRSAGLRTHLLVGVGSCVIMIISIYGFPAVMSVEKRDVARLAAQVVTGVGFLGAGAIMNRTTGGIKGLTTAATIWVSMAIGLACGSFNFILAIVSTLFILMVLVVFIKFEVKLSKNNPTIILNASTDEPLLGKILKVSDKFDCNVVILNTELIEDEGKKVTQIIFQAYFSKSKEYKINDYISELEKETKAEKIQLLGHNQ